MLWKEHKGLWRNPVIFYMMAAALLLNGFLIFRSAYSNGIQGLSANEYKKVYEKISKLNKEELEEIVKDLQENDTLWAMQDENLDSNVYQILKMELNFVGDFDDYYYDKEEEFLQKDSVRIFGGMDVYSKKSARKTLHMLRKFLGTKVEAGPSQGIKTILENFSTDILILFLLLVAMVITFMQRKECGQIDYIKTTFRGRDIFILSKICSLYLFMAEVVFLMYAVNAFCGWYLYGIGDTGRSLQSVYGYIGTGIGGTVQHTLLLFYIYKCLIMSVAIFFTMLFMVWCSNSIFVYTAMAGIYICSGVCFFNIQENSPVTIFKNINLVAFLHTGRIFSSYRNISLFGNPVSYQNLVLFLCMLFFVGGPWIIMVLFMNQKKVIGSAKMERKGFLLWKGCTRMDGSGKVHSNIRIPSFIMQECKKIFIKEKVLLFLLLFVAAVNGTYQPEKSIYGNEDDVFYRDYINQIQGECTDEKIVQILKWKNEIDLGVYQMKKEMKESKGDYSQQAIRDKYKKILQKRQAVTNLYAHAGYIKGISGGFFYDRGYQELTGGDIGENKDGLYALGCVMTIILLLSGVYSRDYAMGMQPLIYSTENGRQFSRRSRFLYGFICTLFVFALAYGSWYLSVFSSYGMPALDSPVISMEHISKEFCSFTVFEYLFFINVIRFVGFLIVMVTAEFLSSRLKSTVLVMISLIGIFVLPLILYLIGMDFMKWALLNPLFLGNLNG